MAGAFCCPARAIPTIALRYTIFVYCPIDKWTKIVYDGVIGRTNRQTKHKETDMYALNLSTSDRKALKESGMTNVVVLEERSSGSRLLRGKSAYGDTLYGVWHEGEAADDIRWAYERANA